MNEVRDMAFHFEAVKLGFGQAKDGITLKLSLHPDEVPKDLMLAKLGTRYMVAMVQIADDDTPQMAQHKLKVENAKRSAGILCEAERFQTWLNMKGHADDISKSSAEKAVRSLCGVKSRAEFSTNEEALNIFLKLRDEFQAAIRNGEVP